MAYLSGFSSGQIRVKIEYKRGYMTAVIIPIFKTEAYLELCVRSVFMQAGCRVLVLLVLDSERVDASYLLALRLLWRYKSLIVLQKSNGGLSSARNAGVDFLLKESGKVGEFSPLSASSLSKSLRASEITGKAFESFFDSNIPLESKIHSNILVASYKSKSYGEVKVFATSCSVNKGQLKRLDELGCLISCPLLLQNGGG